MATNDDDSLEHWEGLQHWQGVLSPGEMKALRWITLDPTRPFCSRDLMESAGIRSKGTARNINYKLNKQGIIELYCRSIYAFYKLKSVDRSKIKKSVTLSRMGGNGLRRVKIDLIPLLDSMAAEELCRVHDVRLTFLAGQLYNLLLSTGVYKLELGSKDIFFGSFEWSKYRSVQVFLHCNGKVSFVLDCGNCPIEASTTGFVSMAGFLGGIRNQLLNACRIIDGKVIEEAVPLVDVWKVVSWHYGKDSAQEFSGEGFNITFQMWCGLLARIYVHEQDHSRKVRFEIAQTPKESLQEVIAKKLNLCCGRCPGCLKQSS
ncbi:MAG: hypothetical protein ABSD92_07250 [Candidatus Bathyarchaeia archaeon]